MPKINDHLEDKHGGPRKSGRKYENWACWMTSTHENSSREVRMCDVTFPRCALHGRKNYG